MNIVIDPNVEGRVDVALRDVPWDQALDLILRSNRLGYIVDGTIIRIAPLSALADEEADRRKLAEEQALAGELIVFTRTLSYARAADMASLITQAVLSTRGQIQVDERTNTLIITDLQERLTTADELIVDLDRAEPQVEIEARIVQTNRNYARQLGIQWGVNGRVAPELGNTTPLSFPNRGHLSGRTGLLQGPGEGEAGFGNDARALEQEDVGTAVNLAATNATSAIGLALGAVDGAFNLDVALSALESEGQGRILSTPRVTTQNNVTAEIIQGDQIPIQTVSNNTVTVTFQDAAHIEGDPTDHGGEYRDHGDRSRQRRGRFQPCGQRDSADHHSACKNNGASGGRGDDRHRWNLRERPDGGPRSNTRAPSDSVAGLVVQA